MKHWLTTPMLPDDEWVGRQLKNAFEVEETVVMQVKHWKYFDWLAERGSDMEQWVKDADMARHKATYHVSLSDKMVRNLFHSEKRRYLSGKECPLFISPGGYFEDGLRKKLKEYPHQTRQFLNSHDEEVNVELPENYWAYFEWLKDQKNINMQEWVVEADKSRHHQGFEVYLNSELRQKLRDHERINGRKDSKWPLFINVEEDDR